MEVNIKNYQILEDVELKFIRGLNVIVGDTNNGKSSIFRAIESAIFNKLGSKFIKKGREKAEVRIKDSGCEVIWQKFRDQSPATIYWVNGEKLESVGRTQVEEVADALDIREIRLSSDIIERLNFWKQMKYPFLLDKTGSQLFEFLSLSSKNNNLTEIVKDMRKDLKDIKKDINRVEGSIDSTKNIIREEEKFLKTKEGFGDVYNKIIDIEVEVCSYKELKKINNELNNLYNKFKNVNFILDKLINLEGVVEEKVEIINNLLDDYNLLLKVNNDLDQLLEKERRELNRKNNAEKIINKIDLGEVEDLLNRYILLERVVNDINQILNKIEIFNSEKIKYEGKKEELDRIISKINIKKVEKLLNRFLNKKKEYNEILNIIKEISSYKENINKLKNNIQKYINKIEKVRGALNRFEFCPLCGNRISGRLKNE